MDSKLKELLFKCKNTVHLVVNQHRAYHMTAQEYIDEDITAILEASKSPLDEYLKYRDKMIEIDTVIDLQFYPITAISSYQIYHFDMDMALNEALNILRRVL